MHSPKGVAIIPFVKDEQPYDDDEGIAQNAEGGGGLLRRMMLVVAVALTLAMSGAASAAPPHNVPNNMMRLISTTLPVVGQARKDRWPPRLATRLSGRRWHRRIPQMGYL